MQNSKLWSPAIPLRINLRLIYSLGAVGDFEDGDVDTSEVLDEEENEPGTKGYGDASDGENESSAGFLNGFFVSAGGEPFIGAEDEHNESG